MKATRILPKQSNYDPTVFTQFYQTYVARIYRYIYYKVGNHQDAEDLCEQVFLKAWETAERYNWRDHEISPWLYRVAHNIVVDHYRQKRDLTSLSNFTANYYEPSDHNDRIGVALDTLVLSKAIAQLTGDQRQVIALRFIEGYSTDEVAHKMNKTVCAIRSVQHRALKNLRDILMNVGEHASLKANGAIGV